ncbi:MAG: Uma2 family endonuclease [Chloroflexi bacterium]|nr:Uma2 family endonuclease [Chloroflexota bacterium]
MADLQVFSSQVVATDVSLDEYMERYAADNCEWIEGVVIKVSPVTVSHNRLMKYLALLLDTYFEFRAIGVVLIQPFVMRLPAFPNRRREPDLMVVLKSNPHELKETYLDGPADICIEIVSEESGERDYGEKFIEYEKGGVREYWIIDALREETRFYRLDELGRYRSQTLDQQGYYRTPLLPSFRLHVPTLWETELPGPAAVVTAVQALLAAEQ